jgi:GH15 family glucan-1,4-alpha-glucosidase
MKEKPYPPLSDYGYIADCHSSALVSKSGSIDWCCMPRFDSQSCFGRLLGWEKGGYCQVSPLEPSDVSRRYLENTLVLETEFRTDKGTVLLQDCFAMRRGGQRAPHKQILRLARCVRGTMELSVRVVPRFDYGAIRPWIRRYKREHFAAVGGSDGLIICGDMSLELEDRHSLAGRLRLEEGQQACLSILHRFPEELSEDRVEVPDAAELRRRLQETADWWQRWFAHGRIRGRYAASIGRSAVVLKALGNAPTGAIVAAPTTSLPESLGGSRNWDYRFTWIRDSSFTVRSLGEVGFDREAEGFRRFVERSAAGSADEVQVFFGVGGERRLHEFVIKELEGYGGSKPVRAGNAAEVQRQLDVYGNLLELAWSWSQRGHSPDADYWEFLSDLVNKTCQSWKNPDRGIWEFRGAGRHFVHSKVMCWAAMNRGVQLVEKLGCPGPVKKWRETREEIRRAVEERGYDKKRGVFIQAFDVPTMDSALLLLPTTEFVDYADERMVRTTDAIREELEESGLLRRYGAGTDGMEGTEGVFLPCTFWLAECLAYQGRSREAHAVFRRALAAGNDLGLFSEEYEPKSKTLLGNFPQGLTHLSLIAAAVALTESKTD